MRTCRAAVSIADPMAYSFTLEQFVEAGYPGGMEQPLAMRVDGLANGIRRAIRVWEQAQ